MPKGHVDLIAETIQQSVRGVDDLGSHDCLLGYNNLPLVSLKRATELGQWTWCDDLVSDECLLGYIYLATSCAIASH